MTLEERHYSLPPRDAVIAGLTLEQARAHCRNKNTSSRTAISASAKAITEKLGSWTDFYEKEED